MGQVNPIHNSMRGWVQWAYAVLTRAHPPSRLAGLVGWRGAGCAGVRHPLGAGLDAGLGCRGVWSIAVLYATLGFRQFSHHFTTAVRDALLAGDEELARQHLATWMRKDLVALQRSQIVRHVIAYSVIQAHRHVFGVFAWYSLLAALGWSGGRGAVSGGRVPGALRQPATAAAGSQRQPVDAGNCQRRVAGHGLASSAAYGAEFAFVGSFEEAIDAWRRQEALHPGDSDGVILAATAGAVNVQPDDAQADTPTLRCHSRVTCARWWGWCGARW